MSDIKGKHLLVLAGAAVHMKVVEAAHALGIRVTVADYLPVERSPAKRIADAHLETDIYDVDALVAYCKTAGVDGVVDFCIDPAQRPAQQIAERVGLPAFGTYDQVTALTDKTVFKRCCAEAGVSVIPTYAEEDMTAGRVPFPVVIKPVDSRGSRGARRCTSAVEAVEAIAEAKKLSSNGGCIIERWMDPEKAQDLTISYLVKDGEPVLVSLGDRHSGRREDNLDRQLICTIQPSRYVAEYLAGPDARIKKLIRLIGVRNGPVFFQGFYDDGDVRLYDPGIRFPGNEYERILAAATGVDLMKSIVRYCVGGEIDDFGGAVRTCFELGGKTCLQYMVNAGPGCIAVYEGLDGIARHPDVVDVVCKHEVGDVIEATGDIGHRIGEISVLCERTPARMKEMIRFIQGKLVVRDGEGRNMLISPFPESIVDKWYGQYGDSNE